MERHDYDVKQREDDMINVLSEDVHARGYSVNIIFEYKTEKYLAWGHLEEDGQLGDYWGVDVLNQGEVSWKHPNRDKLEDIAHNLMSDFHVTKDKLEL